MRIPALNVRAVGAIAAFHRRTCPDLSASCVTEASNTPSVALPQQADTARHSQTAVPFGKGALLQTCVATPAGYQLGTRSRYNFAQHAASYLLGLIGLLQGR